MKRTKKLVSGLLVLMMLAGLMTVPVGATEAQAVPGIVNGNFDVVGGISYDEEGNVTAIDGWRIIGTPEKTVLAVKKETDEDYVKYANDMNHGNYLSLQGLSGTEEAIAQTFTGIETETPYQVSMWVKGGHDCIRFSVAYGGITAEEKEQYSPSIINYEKNTGTRYYCWNGKGTWQRLSFNLILPAGCDSAELKLSSYYKAGSDTVCFDDIEIKKVVNLFSGVDVIKNSGGKFAAKDAVSHKVAEQTWDKWGMECGYEFWFSQNMETGAYTKANVSEYYGTISATTGLGQFVPLKNNTLYKLRFRQNSGTASAGMKVTFSFAEDTTNGGATIVKSFTADETAYSRTYREAYIYVNGDFKDQNGVKQDITEAKILFTSDEKGFWLEEPSLEEVDAKDITVTRGGAEVDELISGEENVLAISGTVYKAELGGADKATLFVGVYEGNKLTDIKAVQLDCGENDSATQTISDIKATKGEGVQVKAFLWDANGGMKPLELVTIR